MKRYKTRKGWVKVDEYKGKWTIVAEDDNANILVRGTLWMMKEKIRQMNR